MTETGFIHRSTLHKRSHRRGTCIKYKPVSLWLWLTITFNSKH